MAVTVESIPEFRAEKVKCDMCGKGVPVSNPYYCDKCMTEIKSRTISSPI
jgi:predicted amidophosphoribosyltransferase